MRGKNNRSTRVPISFVFSLGVFKQPKRFLICDTRKCLKDQGSEVYWSDYQVSFALSCWGFVHFKHQSDPILKIYALRLSFIQAFLRETDASAVVKTSHCLENGDSVNL